MPFLKGQKGVFFVSVEVFRCLFSLSDDESTNLAVIEGKVGFNFSAKALGRAFSLCGAEVVFASI